MAEQPKQTSSDNKSQSMSLPQQITLWYCDICKTVYATYEAAELCEKQHNSSIS